MHSQYDIGTLSEYYPEPKERCKARGDINFGPELINDVTSTCSVYIPILMGSTFWINYSVSPPVPSGHYFLFKLYINGAHIVSWSTGKEEAWKGKTMFGLFESKDDQGKCRIEKRVLCFAPPDGKDQKCEHVTNTFDSTAHIEIKVHRASGRKRVERVAEEYETTQHAQHGKGIKLGHEAIVEDER